jgi:hypothetical protein
MLADLNGFCQQCDVVIDGMHNWMNVIKPLCHMTVDILLESNLEFWLDELLQDIRRMLPGCFTNGRRVSSIARHNYIYLCISLIIDDMSCMCRRHTDQFA